MLILVLLVLLGLLVGFVFVFVFAAVAVVLSFPEKAGSASTLGSRSAIVLLRSSLSCIVVLCP